MKFEYPQEVLVIERALNLLKYQLEEKQKDMDLDERDLEDLMNSEIMLDRIKTVKGG